MMKFNCGDRVRIIDKTDEEYGWCVVSSEFLKLVKNRVFKVLRSLPIDGEFVYLVAPTDEETVGTCFLNEADLKLCE